MEKFGFKHTVITEIHSFFSVSVNNNRGYEWGDILLTQKKSFLSKYKFWKKKRTWGFPGSNKIIAGAYPYLWYSYQ